MKEKSIEEKAHNGKYKVYTELINRLEDVKDAIKKQNYGIAMDILCKPYPQFQVITHSELKESEDERIRKEIIFYFKEEIPQCSIQEHTDKMREFVAWLEKQGNNMGISKATKQKLEDSLKEALEKETAESFNAFLDEQGEQKDILEDAVVDSNEDGLIADTIRYKREKRGEQKSDETEKGRNGNDREIPNSTWSEEEERIIDRLCEILYDCHSYGKCSLKLNEYSNLYDWLKSLRPQNTWKPSDEQMKLLREVQQALLGKDCHNRFVNFMYELKRLREE